MQFFDEKRYKNGSITKGDIIRIFAKYLVFTQ